MYTIKVYFFSLKQLATTYKFNTKRNVALSISLARATSPTHYVTTVNGCTVLITKYLIRPRSSQFSASLCAGAAISPRQYHTHTHTHKMWAQVKGVQRLPEWKRRTSGVQ